MLGGTAQCTFRPSYNRCFEYVIMDLIKEWSLTFRGGHPAAAVGSQYTSHFKEMLSEPRDFTIARCLSKPFAPMTFTSNAGVPESAGLRDARGRGLAADWG